MATIAAPLLIEPFATLTSQRLAWSAGFAAFAVCLVAIGWRVTRDDEGAEPQSVQSTPAPRPRQAFAWVTLAAIPSGLLVALTAHITAAIAAAPLLWVIPLALYLVTFIIAFQDRPALSHSLMLRIAPLAIVPVLALPLFGTGSPALLALHLAAFFLAAMICHGELVARRPDPAYLTSFYLYMSLGGAIGGLFSSLVAPAIFPFVLEYPLLLAASLAIVLAVAGRHRRALRLAVWIGMGVLAANLTSSLLIDPPTLRRGFFGVVRIADTPDRSFRVLYSGTTPHGAQTLPLAPPASTSGSRPVPLTYYTREGPFGDAFSAVAQRIGPAARIGVVGLGIGSLACLAPPEADIVFYEIDPRMVGIARDPTLFTVLSSCGKNAPIRPGDARVTLALEADATFDLLVIDAFTSDSVPTHLLTIEAMRLYRRIVKPDGLIAVHVSNDHMELASPTAAAARALGLVAWRREDDVDDAAIAATMRQETNLVMIARDTAALGTIASDPDNDWDAIGPADGVTPWTDETTSVLSAIWRKFRGIEPQDLPSDP